MATNYATCQNCGRELSLKDYGLDKNGKSTEVFKKGRQVRKREIPEIMRPQYKAYNSEDGVDYEARTISMFDIVHICDYYYKDFQRSEKKNLPKAINDGYYMPVFFHHNDYWIIDGFDLARVITSMSLIHKRDWRKVVNGKWRLQPDWLMEWHKKQREIKETGNNGEDK